MVSYQPPGPATERFCDEIVVGMNTRLPAILSALRGLWNRPDRLQNKVEAIKSAQDEKARGGKRKTQ